MLVSILIATRKRPARLLRTIKSMYKTCTTDDFEILLRADDDDLETLDQLEPICREYPKVKYIVGPRYEGYASHHIFMRELAEIATGKWMLFYDDDGVLVGKGWDEQLQAVPTEGYIVHPEFYQLNRSMYPTCVPVSICVPHKVWERFGENLNFPIDAKLQQMLEERGWVNWFLKDIICVHKRDNDVELAKHRAL